MRVEPITFELAIHPAISVPGCDPVRFLPLIHQGLRWQWLGDSKRPSKVDVRFMVAVCSQFHSNVDQPKVPFLHILTNIIWKTKIELDRPVEHNKPDILVKVRSENMW